MRLSVVEVASSNMPKTIEFYEILGITFQVHSPNDSHIEAVAHENEAKLMLDSKKMMTDILGHEPQAATHSTFGIEYDSASEIDTIVAKLKEKGFEIFKEPWDAFWGQHYAIVKDPDGYYVDLFCAIKK